MIVRTTVLSCALLAMGGFAVLADDDNNGFNAKLSGFQETPPILTDGHGTFTSSLNAAGTSLSFTLTFSGLSSSATMAHIHFAQAGVAGNIIAFLCGGPKPACPSGGGTVTGTITGADIIGVASQGITAGSFADFLRVLRSGEGYTNVHTTNHPGGEIRGQVRRED